LNLKKEKKEKPAIDPITWLVGLLGEAGHRATAENPDDPSMALVLRTVFAPREHGVLHVKLQGHHTLVAIDVRVTSTPVEDV